MFLNVDNVGAERMFSGRLFQATGPATQNARLPSCSLVLGTTKSPRAAERRAEGLGSWDAQLVECVSASRGRSYNEQQVGNGARSGCSVRPRRHCGNSALGHLTVLAGSLDRQIAAASSRQQRTSQRCC